MKEESEASDAEVRAITAAETIPLRHSVLRAGRPLETARFPGDADPGVVHLGAFRGEKLLAVASLYPVEMPERSGIAAFQLRGMATVANARGAGLGTMLVKACIGHVQEKRSELLWCNARTSAAGFYCGLGFEQIGDEFQIPDVGPHFRMVLAIVRP